jgi:peptide/nickel transport system permease protein
VTATPQAGGLPATTSSADAAPARRRRPVDVPAQLTVGACLLTLIVLLAILAPIYTAFDPVKIDMRNALQPPDGVNWLGSDNLGRDVFTRVAYGARLSLLVGVAAVVPAAVLGIVLGIVAGYFGGWLDELIMRTSDILLAFPILILAMGIAVALGRSLSNAVIAMAIVLLPTYARLARSQVLSVRHRDFIAAARVLGARDRSILRHHILPNSIDTIIVQASLDVGVAIIVIASLSFLGVGAQPPTPEWGAMILEGKLYIREAWWISTFPGVAMFLTVLVLFLVGDGLRDWVDRSRAA